MRVSTDELRRAALLLLKHLEETGQREFEIEEDLYWSIPASLRYGMNDSPKEPDLTVGKLSDDWAEVKEMIEGQCDPLGYALIWLSTILRRIGEKAVG